MARKTKKFDVQDHLKTLDEQIAYLEAAIDEDDPSFIATAIGDIATRGVQPVRQGNRPEPRGDLQILPPGRQSDD